MKPKYPKVLTEMPRDAKEPFVIDGVTYYPKDYYGHEELHFKSKAEMRRYYQDVAKNHPDNLQRKAAQFTLECMLDNPSDETVRKWAKELGYIKE